MEMKKIVAGLGVFALSLSVAPSAFADTVTGTKANATAPTIASHDIQLEVEVLDTLSLDCYDSAGASGDHTVTLGDSTTGAGYVVAGVPSVGASTCEVVTNDDQGYYLTIENTTNTVTWADAGGVGTGVTTGTTVLTHEDANIDGTWYNIADLTAYDSTGAGNAAAWVVGTTEGLGFSVIAEPDSSEANNALGDNWDPGATPCLDGTADATGTDTAEYAGVPDTAEPIVAVPEYVAGTTTTEVCYKVDVPATQQSGEYAGQVTFTATSDASTYVQ